MPIIPYIGVVSSFMGSLSLDHYHFYFFTILKETLTFLSLSNLDLQYIRYKLSLVTTRSVYPCTLTKLRLAAPVMLPCRRDQKEQAPLILWRSDRLASSVRLMSKPCFFICKSRSAGETYEHNQQYYYCNAACIIIHKELSALEGDLGVLSTSHAKINSQVFLL